VGRIRLLSAFNNEAIEELIRLPCGLVNKGELSTTPSVVLTCAVTKDLRDMMLLTPSDCHSLLRAQESGEATALHATPEEEEFYETAENSDYAVLSVE
jgi:hypothetical protein